MKVLEPSKLCTNCETDLHYEGQLYDLRSCGCKMPVASINREIKCFGAKKLKFTRALPKKNKPWN